MATGYQLHKFYIGTALQLRELSHCVQHKSGAVLVKNGSIIAHGVNGTPQGMINCDELFDSKKFNTDKHDVFSSQWELTAEMNCIMHCSKYGINCSGSELYCTYIPKKEDIKYFSVVGVKRIVYVYDDEVTEESKKYVFDICQKLGIYIEKM